MNRATILLVQASLLGACGGGAPAAAHPEPAAECVAVDTSVPLAVSRIEGDGVVVHTLIAPDSSAAVTSHVVETEGHLVVFDTQLFRGYARQLREYVDGLGKPIDRVVITHGHPDHYLGLELFEDAPSWAFEETRVDIQQRQRFHIRMHRETERECDAVAERAVIPTNVLEEGDWVDVDGKFGKVTSVGLRLTQLRAFDGTLWHVPNGEVKIVGNLSKEWVRVVAKVGIAYEADLGKGLKVLQQLADEFREKHAELCYEDDPPVAQGVVSLDDSSVSLRLVARVRHGQSGDLWPLQRELFRAIKERFDAEEIEIPFPRRVVYHKTEEGDGVRVVTEAA